MSNRGDFTELPKASSGRFPISASVISGIAVMLDTVAIIGAGVATYFWWISTYNIETFGIYAPAVCSIWITALVLFQFSDLYRFEAILRPVPNLDRMIVAFATGFLFLLAAAFAFKVSSNISRVWTGTFGIVSITVVFGIRLVLSRLVLRLAHKGVFSRNMIIVGKKSHVTRLLEWIQKNSADFVSVNALFVDKPSDAFIGAQPVVGDLDDIAGFVRKQRVDDIVIALPWSDESRILELVSQLRELPVNVYLGSDLVGLRLDFYEPPEHFGKAPIFSIVGQPMSGWGVAIKAIEDYVLGLAALLILALPMLVIAAIIRWDSPGPVLFKQKRFGFNNREFWIYKFRTMHHNSVPEQKTLQARQGDPRVTRIGRFLRRSSLDELPQLLNVLEGNMSIVGPRPHAVDHNEEYAKIIGGYFARHRVKPGITGWAQVNGLRGETDTPDKMEARVRHDVYYAENWSLLFDLRILFQTIVTLAIGRNAY